MDERFRVGTPGPHNNTSEMTGMRIPVCFALIFLGALTSLSVRATEVTLIAAGGIQVAVERMAPDFERVTGYKLKVVFGPGGITKDRIIRGQPFDVAVVQSPYSEIIASGNVITSSETPLASVAIGLAVHRGTPKPDISTPNAVKQALLGARLISYPNPASGADAGISIEEMLRKLDIAEQVAPKVRLGEMKMRSMALLARGDVDIGMTYVSEINDPNVDLVGPLPRDVSTPTALVAFVSSHAKDPAAATALIKYLSAPAAADIYRTSRLEPVSARD
jgi:molybdate transport system substrate-binding protein